MYNLFARMEKAGYFGCDVSLEISLFEYNFLMRETETKGEYQVILALYNDEFPFNVMFDYGFITEKDIKEFLQESWFHSKSFYKFLGTTKTAFSKLSLVIKFSSLLSYCAPEEFGFSCYFPCSIYSLARQFKVKE